MARARGTSMGQAGFAAVLIGIGGLGLIAGDFTAFWVPLTHVPAHKMLACLCAGVSLLAGLLLLWRRTPAAAVLLAFLVLWLLAFKLPGILRTPGAAASWESGGEILVMVAGACALIGARRARIARLLLGLALLPLGAAHFAYLNQTAALVPGWLPAHTAWVMVTGAAYLVAGLALLTGIGARWAAAAAAAQMGLFTLLIWVPMVIAAPHDIGTWSELLDSAALTSAAWLVATS